MPSAPANGVAFFDQVGEQLAAYPPPQRDAALLREVGKIGIGVGRKPSRTQPPAVLHAMNAAYAVGRQRAQLENAPMVLASRRAHNGWFVAPSSIGAYGTDYSFRAIIALIGLGANLNVEAIYPDNSGPLDSTKAYVLHFAPGTYPPGSPIRS